jgi:hypothetical protein
MYITGHFVTQNSRSWDALRFFSTEDAYIGSAYRVGSYLDENFVWSDLRSIDFDHFHLAWFLKHSSKHPFLLVSVPGHFIELCYCGVIG